jgi:VWFA-related protein
MRSNQQEINRTAGTLLTILIVIVISDIALSAVRSGRSLQNPQKQSEQEPLRLDATLIQVPAIVTDHAGKFIADLSQNDFTVSEDGKRQDISLFAAVKQPFNAVLVLDTSNSAQDRLAVIQNAAVNFTNQLRDGDRMMAISFDNEIRQLTDFTADRKELEQAIKGTESGFGKLLYEAVTRALETLREVEGRRAVVLFSDGVDMRSIEASAESSIRLAEEIGAVIYVVHFDTRWWIEAEARREAIEHPKSKTPFVIDGRIPLPPDFGGPDPTPTGIPKPGSPRIEIGQRPQPPVVVYDPGPGGSRTRTPDTSPEDEIGTTLNKLYGEADSYLQSVTSRTGGKVYLADTFADTRAAFASIADELRNQYLIGYYSTAGRRDGKYHKIKLDVARKGLQVRARPGYRVASESAK